MRVDFPEQRTYELIRPLILFGQPLTARAEEMNTPSHVLRRLMERFDTEGMCSHISRESNAPAHRLPPLLHQLIIDLQVEHPSLPVHEIATICYARTGRRPDARTIKQILAATFLPQPTTRRFPTYHQIANLAERIGSSPGDHMDGIGDRLPGVAAALQRPTALGVSTPGRSSA